jgi:DNA-3-methyladenine glycosylase II
LSTKAAATIHQRFLDIYDGKPHPELVINTNHEQLRSCGLSNQKANYVKNLATYFLDQPIEKKHWNKFEDEEIIQMLSSIKGIGKWTVQMTLMFTLERPNVFPIDDLIIKNSVIYYYNLDKTDKNLIQNVHKIAEKWSPYRSFACYYFWAAKDNLK